MVVLTSGVIEGTSRLASGIAKCYCNRAVRYCHHSLDDGYRSDGSGAGPAYMGLAVSVT